MSLFKRVVRLLSPGVPAAILPGGKPKEIIPKSPAAQVKATVREFQGRAVEDAATAIEVAPVAAAIFSGGTSVSAWAALANVAGNVASAYFQSRAARSQPAPFTGMMPASFPSSTMMPAMGALPPVLGRLGLGALGGAVVMTASRARTIARAAGALCLKHPAWCANIGGTAAIIALMESGQMPIPRRRRGRGLTPRDLRSFRRVASLVRGFCPTVRRIPSRQIHARKTGIVHA